LCFKSFWKSLQPMSDAGMRLVAKPVAANAIMTVGVRTVFEGAIVLFMIYGAGLRYLA